MTSFRARKHHLHTILLPPEWPEHATVMPASALAVRGMAALSPLLSLLPRGGLLKWRAVMVLGRVVADLALQDMERARVVMRRFLWHCNEDSGNLGWGVPEAIGETLANSPALAEEYGAVAMSYVRDTGFADNYLDLAELRQGAYWAIGRFTPLFSRFQDEAWELLATGLRDEDGRCRGVAAWGMARLMQAGSCPVQEDRNSIRRNLDALLGDQVRCEILEGLQVREAATGTLAGQASKLLDSSDS